MYRENKMKLKLTILSMMICLGMLSSGLCQEDAELFRMDVSAEAFDTLRRPVAVFDHDEHNYAAEIDDCAICHHVWEDGKRVADESSEDMPCADCHTVKAGADNPVSLVNAYHTQCRSCHIEQGKGPLLCGQCHKKER
jgi:hypothetical protein